MMNSACYGQKYWHELTSAFVAEHGIDAKFSCRRTVCHGY
jgi:hypothetical protein